MSKICLTLPDGSSLTFQSGVSGLEVAQKIGPRLSKEAIAVKINDEKILDLMTPIEQDGRIRVLT